MAEYSNFFNSFNGDRKYTANEFVSYFANFVGNGIFGGGNALKVNTFTQMDVKVETGKGFINGYFYKNQDAAKTLTLEPSHLTLPRIDRVVLRLDLTQTGRNISAQIKTGECKSAPVAPVLQRDNAYWELGLADIRVNANAASITQSNITDLRLDKNFCGVVVGLVEQPDLTDIFNQYQSKFEEVSTHWEEWFEGTHGQFDDVKDVFNGWFTSVRANLYNEISTDFEDWSRRVGQQKIIDFLPDGSVFEKIVNSINDDVIATKTTTFPTKTAVKEVLEYFEPQIKVTKTTSFNATGIVEKYE